MDTDRTQKEPQKREKVDEYLTRKCGEQNMKKRIRK